jgi:hypothetical protein
LTARWSTRWRWRISSDSAVAGRTGERGGGAVCGGALEQIEQIEIAALGECGGELVTVAASLVSQTDEELVAALGVKVGGVQVVGEDSGQNVGVTHTAEHAAEPFQLRADCLNPGGVGDAGEQFEIRTKAASGHPGLVHGLTWGIKRSAAEGEVGGAESGEGLAAGLLE